MEHLMENPFNFGIPVSPQQLVGRWGQIKTVARDLTNPSGLSYAIIGGRRFGKTSFLEALQDLLIKRLASTQTEDCYVFPILVGLKSLEQRSSRGVFGLILSTLYEHFHSSSLKKALGIRLEIDMSQTQLASFIQNNERECTYSRFSKILEELIGTFNQTYGLLRIVFLIDETEEILDQDWTDALFGQLRSLLHERSLRSSLRCVLAGSSKIIDVREKGSPLLNILKVLYLEAISNDDILEIIHWAKNVPASLAQTVLQQCGGHPFLAQYLMHHAWDSLLKGTEPPVHDIVGRFCRERHSDLEQWQSDIGEAGLIAYLILANADTWLTEAQVKQLVNNQQLVSRIGPALLNLCYHGLVLQDGTWNTYCVAGELFKSWFIDNVLPSLNIPSSPNNPSSTFLDSEPTPHIHLNTRVFPTAYCHAMTAERFPFVTCQIDNTCECCTNVRVSVEVSIQGFSEPCTDTLDVPSGQSEQITLLPILSKDAVKTLTEISPTKCKVLVKRLTELNARTLFEKDYDIELHAFDTALLAMWTSEGHLAEDLADYLSVFVTPHLKEIEALVRFAAKKLPGSAVVGYQGASLIEATGQVDRVQARNISRRQAKAFFYTLKQKTRLAYTNALVNYGKQPDYSTQRVRPPFVSLAQNQGAGQANCLDGAVLFASLLENVGMEPLIVLAPGHAFVGWRIWKGIDEYDFLETTMIGTRRFQCALNAGNKRYKAALKNGDHKRNLFHHEGFIRIVDITACRKRGIHPLM